MTYIENFSSIASLEDAQDACQSGILTKMLLLPIEFGGEDIPENLVYVPPGVSKRMKESVDFLMDSVRSGLSEIEVRPEYRGLSFVPIKIRLTARCPGSALQKELEIPIW